MIDTKFSKSTLTDNQGKKQVKTGNLYQLHAYMTNMVASGDYPADLEGMLLYPETDGPVHLDFSVMGPPRARRDDQHGSAVG